MDLSLSYCPDCGAATRREVPHGDTKARDVCSRCKRIHYVNPRVIVGSCPTWRGRVLLCRRAIEPGRGLWTLPAGYLELGETTEDGARREALEEAGARIEVTGLLGVYDHLHVGQVQLMFGARLLDSDVAPGTESLDVRLFAWDEIPWDEVAFSSVKRTLRYWREVGDRPSYAPQRA